MAEEKANVAPQKETPEAEEVTESPEGEALQEITEPKAKKAENDKGKEEAEEKQIIRASALDKYRNMKRYTYSDADLELLRKILTTKRKIIRHRAMKEQEIQDRLQNKQKKDYGLQANKHLAIVCNLPIFKGIIPKDIEFIAKDITIKSFAAGENIFEDETKKQFIVFVHDGKVHKYLDDGETVTFLQDSLFNICNSIGKNELHGKYVAADKQKNLIMFFQIKFENEKRYPKLFYRFYRNLTLYFSRHAIDI